MQQREQRILKKLAEAREAQASAMSRFIQARARVMQVEARLQSLHTRLAIPSTASEQPADADKPATSAIQKPDATPAAQVVIPPVNAAPAPTEAADPLASAPPAAATLTPASSAEQARASLSQSSQTARPATTDAEISLSVPRETRLTLADEDEEDTKKVPAFRPIRPASPVQQNPGEEETLLIAFSELASREQSANDSSARKVDASDITAKIPVTRQELDQTSRESL